MNINFRLANGTRHRQCEHHEVARSYPAFYVAASSWTWIASSLTLLAMTSWPDFVPAIHVLGLEEDVHARDIGERSDAVLPNGYARA
jgi:hypothetical protein